MLHAGQHMTYHQAFQAATNGLYLFDCTYLQSDGCKDSCYLFGIIRQRDVTL